MSSSEATGETSASLQNIPATYARLKRQYQQTLDRITPHVLYRWVGTTVTIAIFELRIVYAQGVRVPPYVSEFNRSCKVLPSACLISTVVYWSVTLQ
jgi:Rer1 family